MNKARKTNPFLKLAAYMLSAAVLLLPVGSVMRAEAETDAVDIWSAYATDKVLQDAENNGDIVRFDPKVAVNACKGEYESTQLILTANKDISSYNVEVSDLTDGAGNTFEAENILVYHEKYIEVKATFEGNGAETGMYPDALLPIEKAVEYGENTISAGNNQGVYITFNVPADQAAGTDRTAQTRHRKMQRIRKPPQRRKKLSRRLLQTARHWKRVPPPRRKRRQRNLPQIQQTPEMCWLSTILRPATRKKSRTSSRRRPEEIFLNWYRKNHIRRKILTGRTTIAVCL